MSTPNFTNPDPTADNARAQAWAMLTSKYTDAGAWAKWAATLMEENISDITAALGSDTVSADVEEIKAEIGAILAYIPGTITGGSGVFSDSLLTAVKNRLTSDISAYSTGLGATVEAAMFARETARENAQRAAAYTELTTQFSAAGFDMPTGALLAKQTEVNNESSIRLTDSSGKILEESARLALDYNKHIVTTSIELVKALAQVFESEEVRAFEASKATVMLAAEEYRNGLSLMSTKADVVLKKAEITLTAKARQLALEVETMRALALGAQQMVASALNGISASAGFSFSGSQKQAFNTSV